MVRRLLMEEPKRAVPGLRPDTLERVAAVVLAFVALAYVPLYLSMPLARDQGLFAWVAMVVRDGGLPYRDAWEVKGPLVYLVYALPVSLFGSVSWGVRLVDLLFVMGGMRLLYVALRPRVSTPLAILTALVLFTYYTYNFWDSAQADSWASLVLLGCLVLFFADGGRRRPWVALLAGVLLGLLALFKPLYGLFCVLPPVYALVSEPRAWRANVTFVATAALGVLATLGLFVLVFWLRGGLEALVDIQFHFNPSVYQGTHQRSFAASLHELRARLMEPHMLALHVLGLVGPAWYARSARREVTLLYTAYLVGFIALCIQNKFYPYHFFILLPALFVGMGLALQATGEVLKEKPQALRLLPRLGALGLLGFGLFPLVLMMSMRAEDGLDYLNGELSAVEYNATFNGLDFYYEDIAALAEHITESTAPEDTVLVYGFDAGINFLSNRHSPTRFGFQYPLVVGTQEYKARYRAEFLAALEAHPPKLIVVADRIDNNLYRGTSVTLLNDFPALKELLERDYKPEARTRHYLLFRRASPGEASR
ncbi:glycosyltransferase family 39 protein [Archangium violaceum]|nr:glycosyltransferase family 39 protein [Archangium violaceum]